MKLNATSYFAGIGTVVAALAVGFGGALMIIGSDQTTESRNRVQQVMTRAPISTPAAKEKSEAQVVMSSASLQPQPVSQPEPGPVASIVTTQADPVSPVVTKQNEVQLSVKQPAGRATQESDKTSRTQLRDEEIKRAVERENERKRVERKRKQQEIEAAANAVRRMLQDNGSYRQVVHAGNGLTARGFFGNDN